MNRLKKKKCALLCRQKEYKKRLILFLDSDIHNFSKTQSGGQCSPQTQKMETSLKKKKNQSIS